MASGQTLPPQAYTREILTSAFNWLQMQPDSVRKLATTPDALVGLYTRAKRFGNSSLETDAPVSSQNFISDLKNLAEGLKQFDETSAAGKPPAPAPAQAQAPAQAPIQTPTLSSYATQSLNSSIKAGAPTASVPAPSIPADSTYVNPRAAVSASTTNLNDLSRSMIQEVKTQLNLSSDAEVLNMMVALAYKSLKNLLS